MSTIPIVFRVVDPYFEKGRIRNLEPAWTFWNPIKLNFSFDITSKFEHLNYIDFYADPVFLKDLISETVFLRKLFFERGDPLIHIFLPISLLVNLLNIIIGIIVKIFQLKPKNNKEWKLYFFYIKWEKLIFVQECVQYVHCTS